MSTNTITFGVTPKPINVELPPDADFITTMSTLDGSDWPATASVEFRFPDGTVWAATRSGPDMTWSVDKVDVNAAIAANGKTFIAKLFYIDGGVDILWCKGPVLAS